MPTAQKANLTRARHAAAKLIQRFAITCPEDIVLEDIAMALGVLVIEDQLEGAEARLIRKGQHGIMRVKAEISRKEGASVLPRRMTLATGNSTRTCHKACCVRKPTCWHTAPVPQRSRQIPLPQSSLCQRCCFGRAARKRNPILSW
jgi:hypothetical protein